MHDCCLASLVLLLCWTTSACIKALSYMPRALSRSTSYFSGSRLRVSDLSSLRFAFQGRNFDPVSRAPLDASQLIPNLALKEAVRDYLESHGWAHQSVFQPS